MSGWVHEDGDERCFECYAIEWESDDPKPCNAPIPDPSSPCGMVRSGDMTPCDADPATLDAEGWHEASWDRKPHRALPTRCTCGHPIEERA